MVAAEAAAPPAADAAAVEPIVLYDGVCGLCTRSVRWILRHERNHTLRFASLQGQAAAALRSRYPNIPQTLESVTYIDGGKVYLRSKAFLYSAKHLRAPWRWAHALRWMPAFLLDLPYRLIARIRYRVWGKTETCELPSPDHRVRFLD